MGGLHLGYNWQFNNIVVGIEGDYSWADLDGTGSTVGPTGSTNTTNTSLDSLATISGRLGFAANNWLFYVKGGWAWASVDSNGTTTNAGGVLVSTNTSSPDSDGYLLGLGAEWGFAQNWSAKVEYNYIDFSTTDFDTTLTSVPAGVVTSARRSSESDMQLVKVGVSYRFNPFR